MDLVLASESPYRRELLDRLGVAYRAVAHACDEDVPISDPAERARVLARGKADSLAARFPDAFVLGSDQVACVGDRILGKPGDAAAAMEQLRSLRGREHRLLTAVALRHPDGHVAEALDVHVLAMRDLDDDALARYVDADQPFDCCGSYRIERLGITLFSAISGADFTAIVGLPLLAVTALLVDAGFALP